MVRKAGNVPIPNDYRPLAGTERRPSPTARRLGPADPSENVKVTISLRRRPDGPPLPTHDDFLNVPPSERPRMSAEEFARSYGNRIVEPRSGGI